MAKRKKHPRLPNGYGSIRWLGKGRRNPYGVYPPVTEFTEDGVAVQKKALCYVDDWMVGFAVLTAYKAGTWKPGMESEFKKLTLEDGTGTSTLAGRILADYNRYAHPDKGNGEKRPTFAEVYELFFDWKYNGKKRYSTASRNSTQAAFKNCSALHERIYANISYQEMQDILDNCPLKHSSVELMNSLLKQMARYAMAEGIVKDMRSVELLKINIEDDDEHGIPFTNDDLKNFWADSQNDVAEVILLMCYSGFRIGELYVVNVDLKNKCIRGGLKTRTSKTRIVPIHSSVLPIVKRRIHKYGCLMPIPRDKFRKEMYEYLECRNMEKHTPHDCRHTFSRLCEDYGVRENDRKRMLGHKIGDITNDVYGHREVEQLRKEIEKIRVPD